MKTDNYMPVKLEIPSWVIEYNNANHQSSAGKAVKILMDQYKGLVQMKRRMEERIKEIKADERMTYPTATIFANAPLALIQMGMGQELHRLEDLLGLPLTKLPIK